MRKGINKKKDVLLKVPTRYHRVIIPLYIPKEEGYYRDAFAVFYMCLISLKKTSINNLAISVICNACCTSVREKVSALYGENLIDELIFVKDPIGKVNSILKVLQRAQEPLITITDADVLFLNDWEQAVLAIFKAFPKAGAVSPVPIFRTHKRLTYNIWFDYFFSKKLQFKKVKDPEAMTRFANSIGWSRLDKKYKDVILTLSSSTQIDAVVGCNHMTVTYKNEVFNTLPKSESVYQLGGDSEHKYLDIPVVKYDGYRLATTENFAYHMGNTVEDWMRMEFEQINMQEKKVYAPQISKLKPQPLAFLIKQKFFAKFFTSKRIQKWFYRRKGLQKEKTAYF